MKFPKEYELPGWLETYQVKRGELPKELKETVPDFGTWGPLVSSLRKRLTDMEHPEPDQWRLCAGLDLLGARIRNRDAHAYRPGERDEHHWLVASLFVDCFNGFVSWIPVGAPKLTAWLQPETGEAPSAP